MAEGADDSLSQNIRDQFLQCKICLDGLKEPKTLPCLHTFCADCIFMFIERNRIDSRKFHCPICRRQIYIPKNGVEGFPDSFFVASLADIVDQRGNNKHCGICKFRNSRVEAAVLCVECKIELCEECSCAHNAAKVTEGHTMLPLAQTAHESLDNYCRVHQGETVKYYCETCNAPICLPCTFLQHRGHEIKEIKNVRQSFNEDMSGLVLQSKDNIMQISQTKTELVELENELFIRKEAVKTDIRRAVQDLLRKMNEQEAKLMNQLDECYDIVSVSRDRQRLERAIYRLETAHDFADKLLEEHTSPIAQIVNKVEARDNLQQALSYELPDVSAHDKKLDNFVHFLPGKLELHLGSLLRCTGPNSNSITSLRHTVPPTKAIYMHTLRTDARSPLGQVISIGILPHTSHIVTLGVGDTKVKIFNKRGKLRIQFGSDDMLQHPSDMVVTRDGAIIIADCGDLLIKRFDHCGTLLHSFGGSDTFQLPIALTTDNMNKILVCDQVRQRVTIHGDNGDLLNEVEISEIRLPQYICCHSNKVFIGDCENNVISIYTYGKDMHFLAKLTTPDNNSGEFLDCSGMCMDHHGNLLVADSMLDRIHVFNQRGEMSSVVPSGHTFLRPMCLATGLDGMLVVSQSGVDTLESDATPNTSVTIYKRVPVDV